MRVYGVFLWSILWVFNVTAMESKAKNLEDDVLRSDRSLSHVLRSYHWLEETHLEHIPPIIGPGTTSYYGNVEPTSLYKLDTHFVLPTAPYVHPYDPIIGYDYVHAAYSLSPTLTIKAFFEGMDVEHSFLIAQKLVQTPEPQLLRLHGFIHGTNAGVVNANVSVAAQILSLDDNPVVSFVGGSPVHTDGVHCHDGVASPSNFALHGWQEMVFEIAPYWQAFGLYLPASKTAALMIMGQTFFDETMTQAMGEPILTEEAAQYLGHLLG